MGKRKQETKVEHKYYTPPNTQDTQNFRDLSKNVDFSTPIIGAYGNAEKGIDHQIFEADLPEGVKESIKSSQMFNLAQNKGQALSAAAGQEHMARTGNAATLAGMTAPQLVQSGQTQITPFDWGGLVSNGLMGAGTAMA